MVRIDRVMTRGGDKSETSLGDNSRVSKASPRIAAIGAVDEANASIGVLRLHTRARTIEDAMLARIQNDLFDVGAAWTRRAADRMRVPFADVSDLVSCPSSGGLDVRLQPGDAASERRRGANTVAGWRKGTDDVDTAALEVDHSHQRSTGLRRQCR